MKNNLISLLAAFYLLIFLLLSNGCKNNCPTEVVIDDFKTLPHVEESKLKYETDTLTFLSELGEKVVFVKTFSRNNEIVRRVEQVVSCAEDDETPVTIYFDQEESEFIYSGDNDAVFYVGYFPSNSQILDPHNQTQIDNLNPIYRITLSIQLPEYITNLSFEGYAMWENEEQIEFHAKRYNGPYSVAGITYNNVFYWSRLIFGPPKLLYLQDYDVIGFIDDRLVKWIRL